MGKRGSYRGVMRALRGLGTAREGFGSCIRVTFGSILILGFWVKGLGLLPLLLLHVVAVADVVVVVVVMAAAAAVALMPMLLVLLVLSLWFWLLSL